MMPEVDEVATKYCPMCERHLDVTAFRPSHRAADGRSTKCRDCTGLTADRRALERQQRISRRHAYLKQLDLRWALVDETGSTVSLVLSAEARQSLDADLDRVFGAARPKKLLRTVQGYEWRAFDAEGTGRSFDDVLALVLAEEARIHARWSWLTEFG